MFPPERLALMQGGHAAEASPRPGALQEGLSRQLAFCIDVAGEEEAPVSAAPGRGATAGRRDSSALTIFEVDLALLDDPLEQAPRYKTLHRRLWQGAGHTRLYAELRALAEAWQPRHIVIDATGIGQGLASFLARAFQVQTIPFLFTAKSKSDLGWKFLSIIETGRYKEHAATGGQAGELQRLFFKQLEFCQMEALPGPGKLLRWGVPDGWRDPASGELVHDDLLVSAALCAALEQLPWGGGASAVLRGQDPIEGTGVSF
jgi:hypothetical protein